MNAARLRARGTTKEITMYPKEAYAQQRAQGDIRGAGLAIGATQLAPQPVRADSELEIELRQLESAQAGLHDMLNTLTERLQPVLVPQPEGNSTPGSAVSRAGSSVGCRVQDAHLSVGAAIGRIAALVEQLAV